MISLSALLVISPATAQPVPEGIHSDATGGPNMCGLATDSVGELQVQLVRRLQPLPGNDRYTALSDEQDARVWTFTTNRHPAHPAVACRTVRQGSDGRVSIDTQIHCQNTRERCDALYREFEELNAQMQGALEND